MESPDDSRNHPFSIQNENLEIKTQKKRKLGELHGTRRTLEKARYNRSKDMKSPKRHLDTYSYIDSNEHSCLSKTLNDGVSEIELEEKVEKNNETLSSAAADNTLGTLKDFGGQNIDIEELDLYEQSSQGQGKFTINERNQLLEGVLAFNSSTLAQTFSPRVQPFHGSSHDTSTTASTNNDLDRKIVGGSETRQASSLNAMNLREIKVEDLASRSINEFDATDTEETTSHICRNYSKNILSLSDEQINTGKSNVDNKTCIDFPSSGTYNVGNDSWKTGKNDEKHRTSSSCSLNNTETIKHKYCSNIPRHGTENIINYGTSDISPGSIYYRYQFPKINKTNRVRETLGKTVTVDSHISRHKPLVGGFNVELNKPRLLNFEHSNQRKAESFCKSVEIELRGEMKHRRRVDRKVIGGSNANRDKKSSKESCKNINRNRRREWSYDSGDDYDEYDDYDEEGTMSVYDDDYVDNPMRGRSSFQEEELEDIGEDDVDSINEDNVLGYHFRSYLSGSPLTNAFLTLWHLVLMVMSVGLVVLGVLVEYYFSRYVISQVKSLPKYAIYAKFLYPLDEKTGRLDALGDYADRFGAFILICHACYLSSHLFYVTYGVHKIQFTLPISALLTGAVTFVEICMINVVLSHGLISTASRIDELKCKVVEYEVRSNKSFDISYDYTAVLLHCCGIIEYYDFLTRLQFSYTKTASDGTITQVPIQLPPTCCKEETFAIVRNVYDCAEQGIQHYTDGCLQKILELVTRGSHLYTVIVWIHLIDTCFHASLYKKKVSTLSQLLNLKIARHDLLMEYLLKRKLEKEMNEMHELLGPLPIKHDDRHRRRKSKKKNKRKGRKYDDDDYDDYDEGSSAYDEDEE